MSSPQGMEGGQSNSESRPAIPRRGPVPQLHSHDSSTARRARHAEIDDLREQLAAQKRIAETQQTALTARDKEVDDLQKQVKSFETEMKELRLLVTSQQSVDALRDEFRKKSLKQVNDIHMLGRLYNQLDKDVQFLYDKKSYPREIGFLHIPEPAEAQESKASGSKEKGTTGKKKDKKKRDDSSSNESTSNEKPRKNPRR